MAKRTDKTSDAPMSIVHELAGAFMAAFAEEIAYLKTMKHSLSLLEIHLIFLKTHFFCPRLFSPSSIILIAVSKNLKPN